jgi:hypothetical protein
MKREIERREGGREEIEEREMKEKERERRKRRREIEGGREKKIEIMMLPSQSMALIWTAIAYYALPEFGILFL